LEGADRLGKILLCDWEKSGGEIFKSSLWRGEAFSSKDVVSNHTGGALRRSTMII